MKMSSIFKKASVFAIAVTMVLLMVVSVLPAVLAAESTPSEGFGEKLSATNISLSGSITMKYYFTSLDNFADSDYIEIKVPQQDGSTKTTQIKKGDLEIDEKDRYVVEVPVAYAQQTDTITMRWHKDGQASGKVYEKSVRQYADKVLEYAKTSENETLKAECQANVASVTNMLNTGAMTQLVLGYETGRLANEGLFAVGSNPVDNMLADHFYDVDTKKVFDNTKYGVDFVGARVFFENKINLRIYLTCPDEFTTATISKGDQAQTVKIKTDANGNKYVGINNIVSSDFDVRFQIEIGDAEYEYSVLDYAKDTVESYVTSEDEKNTAKALYLLYTYTKEKVVPGYVAGPKEKDEAGKLVPVECKHTRTHISGTSITCSDCGEVINNAEAPASQIIVNSEIIKPVKVGTTGEVSFTFAIAGNIEFSAITYTLQFPEGITANVKTIDEIRSIEWGKNIVGEIGTNYANYVIEAADAYGTFSNAKLVTVTYEIEAEAAGNYKVELTVRSATDANGKNTDISGIRTGATYFEVTPKDCGDGNHTLEYINTGAEHKSHCTTCHAVVVAAHKYVTETYTANGKLYISTAICECGAADKNNVSYAYELGYTVDAEGNKTEKAPLLLLTPSDIKKMGTTRVDKGDITTDADGSYITLRDSETSGEGYLNVFSGKNNPYGVTGQYMMIKYRTTHNAKTQFFFGANNGKTGAYGGDNFYVTTGQKSLVTNGEWQTLIIDLNKMGSTYFKAETEGENIGKFMADYIRWDIFDTNPTGSEQSVDVAYIAMSDDIMSLASFAGNDIYTVCNSATKSGDDLCAVGSYMASAKTQNPFFNATWFDEAKNVSSSADIHTAVDTANGSLLYAEITRKASSTSSDHHVYLMGNGQAGSGQIAPTAAGTKYVAVMYRKHVDEFTNKRFQLLINSNSVSATGKSDTINISGTSYKVDGQWHFALADMSSITGEGKGFDPAVGIQSLRLDYHDATIADTDTNLTDIAFVAFFSSKEEAYEYLGEYVDTYLSAKGGQGCMHDATSSEWKFISNEGTEYEGTRYAVEAQHCLLCGEIAKTRSAVVAANFDSIHVDTADGTNAMATWGTSSPTKAGDMSLRVVNLYTATSSSKAGNQGTKYPAPSFLRDNKTINGGGWAGINGLFSGTAYYRVLDKSGNVLLDWTAKGNSRVATNAGTAVQNAVNNQIGNNTLHVVSDARRFTMNEIDLSAYASYYQAEGSRYENAPITLEYAFQAEGAPEGSDLVMVVKINNIYKNCTSHSMHNVTVEENGKLTVYSECKNCGHVYGSYTMNIGNKAPNYFIGAADLADRVAKDSQVISKTYTLSDDGSYVTVSNIAGKGDGYVNIFSGNKTVTGRYVAIKYRTTYDGTWQFYTTSNSTTPSAAQTTGDNFYLYTYRKASITGGVVNDGRWNYLIIDLAGINPDAFKPYEDGSYMAQFFRWDIFESAKASATVDVAFIAFSDDLKALTGMDQIVTYDYAFAKSGATGAVLPMSNSVGDNNPFFDAISIAGKGSAYSGTVMYDDKLSNMPYAQFTSTSESAEQHFDLWGNAGYKLGGSGNYVGILYRTKSIKNVEFFVNSVASSAQGGASKSTNITNDYLWRFAYIDASQLKSTDGKSYYKDAEGLTSLRFDLFNSGASKGATIEVAFLGFFDGADDMAATLTAYNELYGLSIPTTPLLIDCDDNKIDAGDTFDVTISGVKGAFTSGNFSVANLPAGTTIVDATFGAGVTATVDGNNIVVTAIDQTVFDGTIATITYKTSYEAAGSRYDLYTIGSDIKNGDKSVSRMIDHVDVHYFNVTAHVH